MLTDMTVVLLGIIMLTVSNGKSEQVRFNLTKLQLVTAAAVFTICNTIVNCLCYMWLKVLPLAFGCLGV